ncbi:MAG: hypothetical protein IT425_14545 [Pirellulales bacterium]|nr:hypothetical protein [Pirellulales bacterium]
MRILLRRAKSVLLNLLAVLAVVVVADGQQPYSAAQPYPETSGNAQGHVQQPAPSQAIPPQQPGVGGPGGVPVGYQLNALQQAALDQALDAWQVESNKVITFSCPFERWEYVAAFGPMINNQLAPLNKCDGQLTYSKPDKGSFQITKITTYKESPPPADQPQAPRRGDWLEQTESIGEHWVCDGKSVYEFRTNEKQVIERPLPPRAPGENVLDGPLPFLFGAKPEELKSRYWMRIDPSNANPNQVWINALPKHQQQAADLRQVDVILDRVRQLPLAMQVTLPNGDRHTYMFRIDQAKINGALDRLQQTLFERPRTPFGWKHVVENTPVAQGQPNAQGQPR